MDTELWAEEERREMKLFCRYFCFLFGFVCLFVYAGPGTLTTEPVYRDVAGSETAGLSTYMPSQCVNSPTQGTFGLPCNRVVNFG